MSADLMSLAARRPKTVTRLISTVSELLQTNTVKPLPSKAIPISDVETALKVLNLGAWMASLLSLPQPGNQVKVGTLRSRIA